MPIPNQRFVFGVLLCIVVLATLGSSIGCGGDEKETGTVVPVDAKKEEAQRKSMEQFYKK